MESRSSQPIIPEVKDPNIDGGWGWMVVFSTFVIHIICDGIMYSFGIFYSPFLESFNTTGGLASLVMSMFIGICACAGPIASALLNRYGCRIVSIMGTIISTAGFLLSLVIDRIEVLLLTIGVVAGIGFGLMYLPTIVSVALHFKLKRATAMGISMSGSGIGSMIFAPLLEWLISFYGYWKGALLIATGILLNCLVLSFFYREFEAVVEVPIPLDEEGEPSITDIADVVGLSGSISLPRQSRVLSVAGSNIYLRRKSVASNAPGLMAKPDILYVGGTADTEEEAGDLPVVPSVIPSVSSRTLEREPCLSFTKTLSDMLGLSLLLNYVFLIFTLSSFLHYFGLTAPLVYICHRSTELGISDSSQASLLLSIMGVTNTVGKIAVGIWCDRTTIKPYIIYSLILLVNGISTMMTSLVTRYYQMAIYSAVFGFTVGGSLSMSSIVLVDLLGMEKLNNSYGIFLLIQGLATFVGTPLTGVLRDMTGDYDVGFYLAGGMVVLGSIILFTIPVIQKRFPQ